MRESTGLFGIARAVASGQTKLTDLRPLTQRRVQAILTTYGAEELKGGGIIAPSKIGARLSQPRKVHSR